MAKSRKRKTSYKKHCSSKQEVFQMVQDKINDKREQQTQQKTMNTYQRQLRTINQLRPAMEAARQKMREERGQQA